MRAKTKAPLFTAKTNGLVIRRGKTTVSTHTRIKMILKELGGDTEAILRDIRWERLCKQASLL